VYSVELDSVAESEIAALAPEALGPLAELLALLEVAPWSGAPLNQTNPKANILTHAFGESGLAVYMVLDERRQVYVLRLSWI
jgi:hypothetical protein